MQVWNNQGGLEFAVHPRRWEGRTFPDPMTGNPFPLVDGGVINPFGQGEMELPLVGFEQAKVMTNNAAEMCGYLAQWNNAAHRLTLHAENQVAIAYYQDDLLVDLLFEHWVYTAWVVNPQTQVQVSLFEGAWKAAVMANVGRTIKRFYPDARHSLLSDGGYNWNIGGDIQVAAVEIRKSLHWFPQKGV